jgi:hypothetical protein
MTRSDPGQRQGAHRTHRSFVAALVPSVIAVVAVTALIVAVNVWRGSSDDGELESATTTGASPSSPPSAGSTPSASPSGSASPSRSASSTAPPSSPASATSAAPPTGSPRDVEVVVLNQSGRSGLAAQVAGRLRAQGWTVAATGNFRGVVPATTVYYPPGTEAAAQAAAKSLRVPPRIRPRFGNLSTDRLTVVVTSSYPG